LLFDGIIQGRYDFGKKTFLREADPTKTYIYHGHVRFRKGDHATSRCLLGKLLEKGITVAYGPVPDPKFAYGIGVLCVQSDEELQEIVAGDPANGLNKYEYSPMSAVYKGCLAFLLRESISIV
jgi:hypothetical protein